MAEENKKSKKSWFSKIGDAMFETESSSSTEEKTTSVSDAPEVTPGSKFAYSEATNGTPANMTNFAMPNSTGVFDQKFYESFLKIIEENNVEGIDYYEFSKAKKANDNIPGMGEPLKFQSAFHTLKANYPDLTKEVLLKTADFYLEKLEQEAEHFKAEMDNEISSQITSRQNQVKAKQDEIARKQAEIVKIQTDMVTLQGDINTLNNEAQQIQVKIDSTAKNFQVSLDVLKAQIANDKQNIQNFIQ